jgi:hypothetical protein
MAAAFAFLGIFLTSLLVAELAALSLGDFFGANDEFGLVLAAVAAFATFSTVVFAICYATAKRVRLINAIALPLALFAVALAAVPGLIPWIANLAGIPFTAGDEQVPIALELAVPGLLAVLTQWGLVRRRYLRMAGEDDLTRWPWITTVITVYVLLNPFGLTFILATLKQTSGDMMWRFMSTVTAGSVAALVVMAAIECYIRGRILRRRKNGSPPAANPHAGTYRA